MHKKLLIIALAIGCLFAGAAGGYISARSDAPSAATMVTPGADASRVDRVDVFPGARINYLTSGTFRVPAEVPQGRYLVTPTGSTFGCTWKRLTKNDDAPKHVISAGTPNRGSSDEVVLGASDRYLVLLGDCTVEAERASG